MLRVILEAEFIALAEACKEALWIKRLLKDFNESGVQANILEDNQSCLGMIKNNKFSHRSKHIDTRYHFVKNLLEKNLIQFQYCSTADMVADILTKPLARIKLEKFRLLCELVE